METRKMGGCSLNIISGESWLGFLRACVCFSFPPTPNFSFPRGLAHAVCGFLEQEKLKAKPGIIFLLLLFCTLELGF